MNKNVSHHFIIVHISVSGLISWAKYESWHWTDHSVIVALHSVYDCLLLRQCWNNHWFSHLGFVMLAKYPIFIFIISIQTLQICPLPLLQCKRQCMCRACLCLVEIQVCSRRKNFNFGQNPIDFFFFLAVFCPGLLTDIEYWVHSLCTALKNAEVLIPRIPLWVLGKGKKCLYNVSIKCMR